ncbi:helix-turn-helix domain-containing protein [Paenibacillus roseipurpureus]|uniref:Helix-turn-helix domain-containing protein n=1 Tax=Paenibacillus roseopurpureus TaxID=2918901 RepID=A0AA96LV85_9BACL|nr:helix-turn-helix domain-containing protein [Paenibacillus sp. MBLB1832]WNR45265.1 helix-turn-helix domain-containing protein [Paenibacillus sp. MBLB1832]
MSTQSKRSISMKISFVFAAIFFLIISLTVILSYVSSKSRLEDEFSNTTIALLNQIRQKTEMVLQEIDKESIDISQWPELTANMEDQFTSEGERILNSLIISNKMQALIRANPNISSIYIYSAKTGRILTDKTNANVMLFPDHQWLHDYDAMQSYHQWLGPRTITEVDQGAGIQRNVISLVRAYPLLSGTRKGAIVLNMDEKTLYDLIKEADIHRLGKTYTINEQGSIISNQNKALVTVGIDGIENIASGQMNDDASVYRDHKERRSIFYVKSPYNGWRYLSVVPNLQSPSILLMRNVLIGVAVVMFIFATLIVLTVNRYTFGPLDRLLKAMSSRTGNGTSEDKNKLRPPFGELSRLEGMFNNFVVSHDQMERQVRESLPGMKWKLIQDILMANRIHYHKLQPQLQSLGIKLHAANYTVMVIELDQRHVLQNPRDLSLYTYAIENIAEEYMNAEHKGVCAELANGRVAGIMSYEVQDEVANQITTLQVADLIRNSVEEALKVTVTIGVGRHYNKMGDIHHSYKEAQEALAYKLIMGNNVVISNDDIEKPNEMELHRFYGLTNHVVAALEQADQAKLKQTISHLFEQLTQKNVKPDMIKQLTIHLVMGSLNTITSKGYDILQFLERPNYIYEDMHLCESIEQIQAYLEGLLSQLINKINEQRVGRVKNETMDMAMAYIEQNYMNSELSLNMLADVFNLSVPYMSRLFKSYTESNFMDILIRKRMDRSRELLEFTSKKINEIAEEVGYTNTHSFTRIFKKYTGQTPGEYREAAVLKKAMECS